MDRRVGRISDVLFRYVQTVLAVLCKARGDVHLLGADCLYTVCVRCSWHNNLDGGDREITVEANSTQQDESWKVCLELTPAQPYVRLVARIPIEFMATFSSHNCAVPQLFTPLHCSLPHIAFFYSVPSTSHPQRGPQAHVMYSPSLISPVPTAPPPPPRWQVSTRGSTKPQPTPWEYPTCNLNHTNHPLDWFIHL